MFDSRLKQQRVSDSLPLQLLTLQISHSLTRPLLLHARQQSVQEAYSYYCQIGTAVYSWIMPPSLILSLTITCFTLALALTLIYSNTAAAAEAKKKNIHSACVEPNCPLPILYFCLSPFSRSLKLHSALLQVLLFVHLEGGPLIVQTLVDENSFRRFRFLIQQKKNKHPQQKMFFFYVC